MLRHDDDVRAAFDAFVAARRPDARRRRHNWNETLARLHEDPLDDTPSRRSSRTVRVWIGACAATVVVAIGLAAVLGRPSVLAETTSEVAPSQAVDASDMPAEPRPTHGPTLAEPRREAVVEVPAAPPVPDPVPTAEPEERPRRPARAVAPVPVVVPEPAAITPERLALETDLIARARAAAVAGDDERAVQLLQQHAREHADGAMVEDRRAWLAIVQCRSSAPAAGREAAARFAKAHPRSPYAERVRAACDVDAQSE